MERLTVQDFDRNGWKDFYFYPTPSKNVVFGDRFDINAGERPKPAELITLEAFEASYGQVRFIRICPYQQLVIHTDRLVVVIRNGSNPCGPDRVAFYPREGDLLEQEIRDIPQIAEFIREMGVPTRECYGARGLDDFFSELNLAIVRHLHLGTISITLDPNDALPYSEDDLEAVVTEPKTVVQVSLWRDCYPSAILNFREDGSAFVQSSEEEEFDCDGKAEPWWSMMEKVVMFWQHVHLESQGKEWRKPFKPFTIRQMI